MNKQQRRDHRKAKERERNRSREIILSRTPFDDTKDKLRPALLRAYKDARREYPQLLAVNEHLHDPENPASDADLISKYVARGYEQIIFSLQDGGHTSGGKDFGGETVFFRDPGKSDKAVIFLRTRSGLSDEELATMNIAVFFHELGHVDDFTKGIYLIPGKPNVDIAMAEYHAHQFACRRMFEGRFRISLSIWLAAIEQQMVTCGVPNIEKAAQILLDSADYKKYRVMAEPFMRCWDETFKKTRLQVPTIQPT